MVSLGVQWLAMAGKRSERVNLRMAKCFLGIFSSLLKNFDYSKLTFYQGNFKMLYIAPWIQSFLLQ